MMSDYSNMEIEPTLCDVCGGRAQYRILDEYLCEECILKDSHE